MLVAGLIDVNKVGFSSTEGEKVPPMNRCWSGNIGRNYKGGFVFSVRIREAGGVWSCEQRSDTRTSH